MSEKQPLLNAFASDPTYCVPCSAHPRFCLLKFFFIGTILLGLCMLLHVLWNQAARIPPKLVVKQTDLAGVVLFVVHITQPDHIIRPLVVLVVCDDLRAATDGTRPSPKEAHFLQGLGFPPRLLAYLKKRVSQRFDLPQFPFRQERWRLALMRRLVHPCTLRAAIVLAFPMKGAMTSDACRGLAFADRQR